MTDYAAAVREAQVAQLEDRHRYHAACVVCTDPHGSVAALEAELRAALGEQRHIVEFREDGWGLQHPVECRPDLIGCEVNRAIQEEAEFVGAAPVEELGRYVVTLGANGAEYRALSSEAPA